MAVIIGRESPSDIVVPSEQGVSAVHAVLHRVGLSRYRLLDLNSSNGTFVNGQRVREAVVSPADEVRLGSWLLNWGAYGRQIDRFGGARCFVVGRDPASDLPVPDSRVSARHAVLLARGSRVILIDLGSSNGTFVGGERIHCAVLRGGETIRLGSLPADLLGMLAARGAWSPGGSSRGRDNGREPVRPPEPPVEPPPPKKVRRRLPRSAVIGGSVAAVAALGLLAALFFTGTIWPYWFRPYEDPWPAAVESAESTVRGAGGVEQALSAAQTSAEAAREKLAVLERARPVLNAIDSWKRRRLTGDAGTAVSFLRRAGGLDIPDNAYDAVLKSLDMAYPGSGDQVRELESAVRRALDSGGDLQGIGNGARQLAEVRGRFLESPTRDNLLALEGQLRTFDSTFAEARPRLEDVRSKVNTEVTAATVVRAAVTAAAQTRIGSFVSRELYSIVGMIDTVQQPLIDLEGDLHTATGGLAPQLDALRPVRQAVERARESDREQTRRHAKGLPPGRGL